MTVIGQNPVPTSSAPPAEYSEQQATQKRNEISPTEVPPTEGSFQGDSVKDANHAPTLPAIKVLIDIAVDSLSAFLMLVDGETNKNRMATMEQQITRLTAKLKELTDERLSTIEKNRTEQLRVEEQNRKKSSGGGFLGWVRRMVKLVVAVFKPLLAAVATVATGGLAMPLFVMAALSSASTVIGIASEIDKDKGGKGFDGLAQSLDPGGMIGKAMAALAKEMGASEEQAAIISTTFAITTTLVIAVGAAIITAGASDTSSAIDYFGLFVALTAVGAGIVDGAAAIGDGLADREIAEIERDISMIQSQLKKVLAAYMESSHQRDEWIQDLKNLMEEAKKAPDILSQIINARRENGSLIIGNMAGMQSA